MYKIIVLGSVLFIFYFASMGIIDSRVRDSARDYYQPVAITDSLGQINNDLDDETRIYAYSAMNVKNYSDREQKITFVVFQHNIEKDYDCFFDIDNIYINMRRTDDEVVIQDGIVKVPAGETLLVSLDATARDGSKATTTRSGVGASIEVVILDD